MTVQANDRRQLNGSKIIFNDDAYDYSAKSYAQDQLTFHLDAIENDGLGFMQEN